MIACRMDGAGAGAGAGSDRSKMPMLYYDSEHFSKTEFWKTTYGDNFFRDVKPEKRQFLQRWSVVRNQCIHGFPIHRFIDQFTNKNDKLRHNQHPVMVHLSATNTHPNLIQSCVQRHPLEWESNDRAVTETWKLLFVRGIITDAKWSHSLHVMEMGKAHEPQGENQQLLVQGRLVITCVGRDHDYQFDAATKINVYKKEDGWMMLTPIGNEQRSYLRSSLPRLVEIQLMNAVLLHLGRELQKDGDPEEVIKLIMDEKIALPSTADECNSDVPCELVDVRTMQLHKDPDKAQCNFNGHRAHVIGMERLRKRYFEHFIPKFLEREGFGSRGREEFLKVPAMRLTAQYVLGTTESDARTDDPALLSAADQTFLTFLREEWWPLFRVLAKGPYTTFGLNQCLRNEFYSIHVVHLHTQQPNVYTPPENGMYLGLTRGRMYTMYKQVPHGIHQVHFGPLQKFYTDEHELDRVNPQQGNNLSWHRYVEVTRSRLDQMVQPWEELHRCKEYSKLMAMHQLQDCLDYMCNDDEMGRGLTDSLSETANLPTLAQRKCMADHLIDLHARTREGLRMVTAQVGDISKECNDLLHMMLQVQDLHEEATRCLAQGDVPRAYELIKAVDSYIPIDVSRAEYMRAKRVTIPCLVVSLVDEEGTQFYSGRTGTGGPLDVAVGIDSDSAITATTNKSDLVNVNSGSSYLHNASVTGVGGGVSKIGGMGAMIVRVKVTKPNGTKTWGYLCDPNAAWLRKEDRDEGTVRIFSTTMLKRMRVIFRMEEYNDLDMLLCKRSGNMIETKISHGIVVIDTDSEFDARKFRKNESVKSLIRQIQMKERSPLFFMNDDRQVISLPMDFNCGASCGTSEQGLEEIFDQAKPAIATVDQQDEELQDVVNYEEGEKVLSFVMNESALTQEARTWLWHHRLGHFPFRDASKLGLGLTKTPNCECVICDQKGFKRGPFPRKPEFLRYCKPPYHHVSIDGFGGLRFLWFQELWGSSRRICVRMCGHWSY